MRYERGTEGEGGKELNQGSLKSFRGSGPSDNRMYRSTSKDFVSFILLCLCGEGAG